MSDFCNLLLIVDTLTQKKHTEQMKNEMKTNCI